MKTPKDVFRFCDEVRVNTQRLPVPPILLPRKKVVQLTRSEFFKVHPSGWLPA